MKSLLKVVLLSMFVVVRPVQAQDVNTFTVKGGVVSIESVTVVNPTTGNTTEWYVTQRTTSTGTTRFVRSRCASSSAKSSCSETVNTPNGYVPALLWAGGCTPILWAQSVNDTTVTEFWTCGGSGIGACRVASGWLSSHGLDTEVNIVSLGSCN